jgi:hypothetical protein
MTTKMPKVPKMIRRRSKKVEVHVPSKTYLDRAEPEVITQIQGQDPGSPQEWRYAMALDYLKIRYYYQYEVLQRTGIRGGQRLDFLLKTAPLPTPVYIQSYWHEGSREAESKFKIAAIMAEYRGVFAEPIEVDGSQINCVQDAVEDIMLRGLRA